MSDDTKLVLTAFGLWALLCLIGIAAVTAVVAGVLKLFGVV